MSERETTPQNLDYIKEHLKHGSEPTGLLLALVSSPLMTLRDRGLAQVMTAKDESGRPVVLAIFAGVDWDPIDGMSESAELPTLQGEKESNNA